MLKDLLCAGCRVVSPNGHKLYFDTRQGFCVEDGETTERVVVSYGTDLPMAVRSLDVEVNASKREYQTGKLQV